MDQGLRDHTRGRRARTAFSESVWRRADGSRAGGAAGAVERAFRGQHRVLRRADDQHGRGEQAESGPADRPHQGFPSTLRHQPRRQLRGVYGSNHFPRLAEVKVISGYASLPACSLGKRLIDRKQALLMSLCLHWLIIACNHALLPSKRAAGLQWSATHDCAPEAMRTQGALSEFMRNTSLTTEPPIRVGGSVAVKVLILELGPAYAAYIFMGGAWLSSGVS